MQTQEKTNIFHSFEQLKADLFPRLSDEEHRNLSNKSSSQIGTSLADEAIEELLEDLRKRKG